MSVDQEQPISPQSSPKSEQPLPQISEAQPVKLLFAPNLAPAHMDQFTTQTSFEFFYNKKMNWFDFIQKCTGSTEHISELVKDLTVSSGSLSHPKQQQYSIFEAEPAKWQQDSVFVQATPSDQSKGNKAPIISNGNENGVLWWIGFSIISLVQLCLLGTQFSMNIRSTNLCSLFALLSLLECFVFSFQSTETVKSFKDLVKSYQKEILEQSAGVAVSLPRILISECGHPKFLKPQVKINTPLYVVSYLNLVFTALFTLICLSCADPHTLEFSKISTMKQVNTALLFYGLSIISASLQFIVFSFLRSNVRSATNLARNSVVCNLRGFVLSDHYALDFSDAHQLDEGLCYMFDSAPILYIPYLSVEEAFIHLEPYKVKLQYQFQKQELEELDAKHNERAKEVLKRGYDLLQYQDVLVWIVLKLQNNVKIWLPLSPTQMQHSVFAKTAMFGFTGYEIATILYMISSQIQKQEGAEEKQAELGKIADFCQKYQNVRQKSVCEEALHIEKIDKVVVPIMEE
ncbi:Transmembrane_domain-containing protein [Hexamita inflata]|uniref:Transmembrane domain-containing protein n=1 Tax=Hexamita inflata TaxID=28002 RepID=A0AA86NYU8_9EUKA|nr:Transmembrane domain-containing protein [Hexamita inflata]